MVLWQRARTSTGTLDEVTANVVLWLRSFVEPVFERAGYFTMWGASRRDLLDRAAATGARLNGAFARWARSGCFMHTSNHPKLCVLADVARASPSGTGSRSRSSVLRNT